MQLGGVHARPVPSEVFLQTHGRRFPVDVRHELSALVRFSAHHTDVAKFGGDAQQVLLFILEIMVEVTA